MPRLSLFFGLCLIWTSLFAAPASPASADEEYGGRIARPRNPRDLCETADSNLTRAVDAVLAARHPPPAAASATARWDRKAAPQWLERFEQRFTLRPGEREVLYRHGLVVPQRLAFPGYTQAFHEIYQSQLPIYVSADAILHAVYAVNDSLVAELERKLVLPRLNHLVATLRLGLPAAAASYPPEVARDLDLYLTVAARLLGEKAAPLLDAVAGSQAQSLTASALAARELGVPLAEVSGSGPKGRIQQADVQGFVKSVMAGAVQTAAQKAKAPAPAAAAGSGEAFPGLLPWPKVDFAKFGPIERKDLSRIQKISGANLHRNWVIIPHVTNHDDADITELEAFRVATNKENEKSGIKVTMLAFMIKAAVAALKKFPQFNASLDGEQLVLKNYFHIGFAADTPNGLVVPVIKDADKKGIFQISTEMGELAKKARDGKLGPADMSGGCFSISSLGGIGGRYFTPIINAPEVAIMGVCKSAMEPRWDGKQFVPRLILPLSLSWDHRVIDGAAAARFNVYFASLLADFRRIVL